MEKEAQQDNLGNIRLALDQVVSLICTVESAVRIAAVHRTLQEIWGCGRVDVCREALSAVSGCLPDLERETIEGIYSLSLEYIKGERDPYFMEALQPDVRKAVELLVTQFDGAAIGSSLPGPDYDG